MESKAKEKAQLTEYGLCCYNTGYIRAKKEESIKRRIKEFNDGYATGKHDAKKEILEKIKKIKNKFLDEGCKNIIVKELEKGG